MRFTSAVVLSMCFISPTLAAPPTTTPATQGVVDKAHVKVDRPGCSVIVPKTWKQGQKSDAVITYRLPASAGGSAGTFILVTAPLKGHALPLAEIMDDKKKALQAKSANLKFDNDEATTLDGRDAWELVYDLPTQAKETDTINGKAADAKAVIIHQLCHSVTAIAGDRLVELTFVAPKENAAAHAREVAAVFSSFKWAE